MKHYKLIILGGGSGGISMASRMKKHFHSQEIAIVEPSDTHYYQPFWTLIAAGIGKKEQTAKPMASLIPEGVSWIQQSVSIVHPEKNTVEISDGSVISYDFLIIATGLRYDFTRLPGLDGNLGKHGIHSIYTFDGCEKTYQALNDLKEGTAIFTMPPPPMKCPGAPQKIMYLAEELFSKNGVRSKIKIDWFTAGPAMFGVPTFAAPLLEVVKRKKINPHFGHKIVEIKPQQQIVCFEITQEGKTEILERKFDFLHVIPPQVTHDYLGKSGLLHKEGPQVGFLKNDIHTLQHLDYKNIFGIGDVTGMPNSKTGAAIRNCAPILEKNILSAQKKTELLEKYNGYASCPLVTGYGKVILAEFGYEGKLLPSFPLDPSKERWIYWILKRYLLPLLYWFGMLKGLL